LTNKILISKQLTQSNSTTSLHLISNLTLTELI